MMAEDAAKHEQQVDALAGPEDYWLTITDAARATRRQDITIRRWIATGRLPVRRHAVGLNQRTRQVRASDLARLTPIIDPTAVITGEEGRLNLMSIPVEQAQLKAGQQQLQLQVATLGEHVEHQGQTFRQALVEHRLAFLQLQEALATQFSQVQEALLRTRSALETTRTEQQQRLEHLRTVLAEQLAQHNDLFQRYRQESTTVLAQHGQELERLRQRLALQRTASQEAPPSSQDEMTPRFTPQRSADEQVMEQALQTLEEWMTTEFAKLMDRLETLTAQVAASTQSLDHTQQRLQQQEQQIERLMETTARLTEQLTRHEQTQQRLLSFIEQPPTSRQNEG